jgi:hypothetical protein
VGLIEIVVSVLATAVGFLLLYVFLRWQASFTKPSIDEVEDFVRMVHRPKLEELLDPARNEERRLNPNHYRRDHRVTVELLRNYLVIMLGNATFLRHWGKTEWFDMRKHGCEYGEETIQRIKDLIHAARLFQKLAKRALFVLWIWRLTRFDEWTFVPLPDVASLRKVAGVDILAAYSQLRRAAEALSEEYGEAGKEIARYISLSMLGPDEIGA